MAIYMRALYETKTTCNEIKNSLSLKTMPFHSVYDIESKQFYGEWQEGWRNVPGFEGLYEVNHLSEVRNIRTQKLFQFDGNVHLTNKHKGVQLNVPRYHLTLLAFFPLIPRNGRTVDHIDENYKNNHVSNLQWMPASENVRKSQLLRPHNPRNKRPIEQWSIDGKTKIAEFALVKDAKKATGFTNITQCARGISKTAGGYIWRYKVLDDHKDLPGEEWKTNETLIEMTSNPKLRVSNLGRILSTFGVKTKGAKGTRRNVAGHRKFAGYYVHQLVWAVWGDGRPVPKRGDPLVICHDDQQPRDEDNCVSNAITHLRLDTRSANTKEYHAAKRARKRTHSEMEITRSS